MAQEFRADINVLEVRVDDFLRSNVNKMTYLFAIKASSNDSATLSI
jgi:hypothetical protein